MTPYEQAMALVRHPVDAAGSYLSAMVMLGVAAADTLLSGSTEASGKHIHVLTGVEDYDGFAKGFAGRARYLDKQVTIATYWTIPEVLVADPWLETAINVMSHVDAELDPDALLVAATPIMTGVASTAARLMDALDTARFRQIHVAVAIGHEHAEGMLRRKMSTAQNRVMSISSLALEPDQSPINRPDPDIGLRHLRRLGYGGWREMLGSIPEGIRTGNDWPRKPPRSLEKRPDFVL